MSETDKTAPAKTTAPKTQEPPRYKVLRPSYINDRYVSQEECDDGFEVVYTGIPGSALEPVNDAALEAKANAPVPKEPAL